MCPRTLYAHSAAVLVTQFCIAFYGGQTSRTGRGFDGKMRLVSAVHRDQRRMLWTNVDLSTDLKQSSTIRSQPIVRYTYGRRNI